MPDASKPQQKWLSQRPSVQLKQLTWCAGPEFAIKRLLNLLMARRDYSTFIVISIIITIIIILLLLMKVLMAHS